MGFVQTRFCFGEGRGYDAARDNGGVGTFGGVMRKFVTALIRVLLVAATALSAVIPVTAQAHWRHHRIWHRVRDVGPSYYPVYGFFDENPYGPVCVWHRNWDAYWHRDCF